MNAIGILEESSELAEQALSGRYRIVRALGQGAIGQVYEVTHAQLGRRFAAKVLRREHRASQVALARFRREARIGSLLRSQHMVEVLDYDESAGAPYFVMEYLEGETLHAVIAREGILPVRRAATLIVHACRGVRCAHAVGILHRDLKPSNLFVVPSEGGELGKVLDLGVAKLTDDAPASASVPSTSSGAIIGTLNYMPPEQLRGEPDLDERVDVYALATILYECLTGVRAFEAATPHLLMYQILEQAPRPLAELRPELPARLVAVVERAMAKERALRTASLEALERELSPFAEGAFEPELQAPTCVDLERPSSQTLRATSASTRTKALLYLVVGLFVGTLVGAVGYRAGVGAIAAVPEAAAASEPGQAPSGLQGVPSLAAAPEPSTPPAFADAAPSASAAAARDTASLSSSRVRTWPRAGRSSQPEARSPRSQLAGRTADFDRQNPYRSGAAK